MSTASCRDPASSTRSPRNSCRRYAEWWAHCRRHPAGHQLHFDSDDEGTGGVRNPIISTVIYLTGKTPPSRRCVLQVHPPQPLDYLACVPYRYGVQYLVGGGGGGVRIHPWTLCAKLRVVYDGLCCCLHDRAFLLFAAQEAWAGLRWLHLR